MEDTGSGGTAATGNPPPASPTGTDNAQNLPRAEDEDNNGGINFWYQVIVALILALIIKFLHDVGIGLISLRAVHYQLECRLPSIYFI